MAWVDLSSAFASGSILSSTQMQNLRDNITAFGDGDSGAPSLQIAGIAANAVDTGNITNGIITTAKLATSTTSLSGTLFSGRTSFALTGYPFFPMIHQARTTDIYVVGHLVDSANNSRFGLRNDGANASYDVDYRYIT